MDLVRNQRIKGKESRSLEMSKFRIAIQREGCIGVDVKAMNKKMGG